MAQAEQTPEGRIVLHSWDDVPETFASYKDEAEFWDTHEFASEVWENPVPLSPEEEAHLERIRQKRAARKAQQEAQRDGRG